MQKLLEEIAGLKKCTPISIAVFQALVCLTRGFTKNVAMLVPIQTALDGHDYLRKVRKTLKEQAPDFVFYYHDTHCKGFGVVGLGTQIYEHVRTLDSIAQQQKFDGKDFEETPFSIYIVS